MVNASMNRLAGAVGAVALSMTGCAGLASADPVSSAVNTTCSYEQFESALKAQSPTYAAYFKASPKMQSGLRQFLAAPPDQRMPMAQQMASAPANQPILGVLETVFNTCNTF